MAAATCKFLLSLAALASAAPQADIVQQLPGWDAPLLSRTWAGYIPVGGESGSMMYEHYLLFESEGNPATDPVIMWTNGGPGASSFLGSFSELGPYYHSDASLQTDSYKATGIPSLFENPYRWTRLGSLLVRNLPPPIGFSYCDPAGPSGDGYSCGSWNDTSVAKHSVAFMQNWMKAFPEFAGRDLYLTGESYAGIYVPMLAREILDAGGPLAAQLKGFAVGDGCLGGPGSEGGCLPTLGPYFDIEFFHGHGQFSDETYQEIQDVCPRTELVNGVHTPACKAAIAKARAEWGSSFDYNLYDECYDFALQNKAWGEERRWWGPPQRRLTTPPQQGSYAPHHMDGAPCGGTSVLPHWVNRSEVKKALHVPENAVFFTGDNGVGFTYNSTEPSLIPFYRDILLKRPAGLRVLIYNGDTDPGLNSFYAQNWTKAVGAPRKENWRPWTRDGQVKIGGYVTRYAPDFDFLTIRGAGHMVPEYKPEAAFVFMKSWLRGEDYPHYKPPARGVRGQSINTTTAAPRRPARATTADTATPAGGSESVLVV